MSGRRVDAKVVLLGQEGVGKSSLVERCAHGRFRAGPYQNVSDTPAPRRPALLLPGPGMAPPRLPRLPGMSPSRGTPASCPWSPRFRAVFPGCCHPRLWDGVPSRCPLHVRAETLHIPPVPAGGSPRFLSLFPHIPG